MKTNYFPSGCRKDDYTVDKKCAWKEFPVSGNIGRYPFPIASDNFD